MVLLIFLWTTFYQKNCQTMLLFNTNDIKSMTVRKISFLRGLFQIVLSTIATRPSLLSAFSDQCCTSLTLLWLSILHSCSPSELLHLFEKRKHKSELSICFNFFSWCTLWEAWFSAFGLCIKIALLMLYILAYMSTL